MERAIGEIFEHDREKFKVVEGETCEGCIRYRIGCLELTKTAGECSSRFRIDKQNVIFIKIVD
jgi:hypothetical protein